MPINDRQPSRWALTQVLGAAEKSLNIPRSSRLTITKKQSDAWRWRNTQVATKEPITSRANLAVMDEYNMLQSLVYKRVVAVVAMANFKKYVKHVFGVGSTSPILISYSRHPMQKRPTIFSKAMIKYRRAVMLLRVSVYPPLTYSSDAVLVWSYLCYIFACYQSKLNTINQGHISIDCPVAN